MKLTMIYQPVTDLAESVAFYRDALGFDEAWREGATTVAFAMPGTEVQLMLDLTKDTGVRPGGFFHVESVADFVAAHPDFSWEDKNLEIPDGHGASFRDPSGNLLYLYDQTGEPAE